MPNAPLIFTGMPLTDLRAHSPVSPPVLAPAPGRAERLSLRLMQVGALAVALAVGILHVFELDRFFVPKELVLHLTATAAGLLAFRALQRVELTRVDLLLVSYLMWSAVSAALATNPWVAFRAVAISFSSVVIFWVARALAEGGLQRSVAAGTGFAVFATATTALLQTYGVETLLFSENRVPGGTLGNRNFVAHAAAFGAPIIIYAALTARRIGGYLFWCIAAGAISAAVVLTRSRAGWLAFGAGLTVVLVSMIIASPLRRDGKSWRRLIGIVLLSGAGVAAALYLPNTLRWRSGNPYLESMQRMVDYQEGSGRGRLVQYEHSLLMTVRHPLLGVGPGNWAVEYPDHAARRDPSLSASEAGMTSNPWPSSDWIAFVSERGPLGALLIGLALVTMTLSALRQMRRSLDLEEAARMTTVIATVVAAVASGAFDAVLLLALPSLIVWAALGALWKPELPLAGTARWFPRALFVVCLIVSAAGTFRSASQLVSMHIYANRTDRESLIRAARIDPGNYRVHLRLAQSGPRAERCEHARAAHSLYPHAATARRLSRRCPD